MLCARDVLRTARMALCAHVTLYARRVTRCEGRVTLCAVPAKEGQALQAAIRKALAVGLPQAAVLLCPEAYPGGWRSYAAAFSDLGGLIEASPSHVLGSPTVNVCRLPTGWDPQLSLYLALPRAGIPNCQCAIPSLPRVSLNPFDIMPPLSFFLYPPCLSFFVHVALMP